MSQSQLSAGRGVRVVRLPVDKPQGAVEFLHARGGGVMDLIAHFWDRLPQTPPLARGDLHLVVATNDGYEYESTYRDLTKYPLIQDSISGAMLYVPKAHRADVLAVDLAAAEALAGYIALVGATVQEAVAAGGAAEETARRGNGVEARVAIDFLTGGAEGIQAMVPHLLPLVHKRVPARQLVNYVMQLPVDAPAEADGCVRVAREGDNGVISRWRTMYKQERGILFDADVDAWVQSGKVFIYEAQEKVVALAKFDLDLAGLIEIGGVFTFPEFRRSGYGRKLVMDLASKVRQRGKMPTLQVDTQNEAAHQMYLGLGWKNMGQLARVWLTG